MIICNFSSELWSGLWPQIITAIVLIAGYFLQYYLFNRQIDVQRTEASKTNSLKLIIDLQKEFTDMGAIRSFLAEQVLDNTIIVKNSITAEEYKKINAIEDVIDFFDSLGFYIKNDYVKADLVWENFYHWFIRYYEFYKIYDIKNYKYEEPTEWGNIEYLRSELGKIEVKENKGHSEKKITKEILKDFFEDEKTTDENEFERKNQFEGIFFSMLSGIRALVNSIRGNINYISEEHVVKKGTYDGTLDYDSYDNPEYFDATPKGQRFIEEAGSTLKKYVEDYMVVSATELSSIHNESERLKMMKQKAKEAYDDFFDKHATQLAHYFRYVYNVIKYVDCSDSIGLSDKKKYINFIQAQMSADELTLLFYNGIGEYGGKFHDYMMSDKYDDFLQNVHGDKIYSPELFMQLLYPGHKFRFLKATKN